MSWTYKTWGWIKSLTAWSFTAREGHQIWRIVAMLSQRLYQWTWAITFHLFNEGNNTARTFAQGHANVTETSMNDKAWIGTTQPFGWQHLMHLFRKRNKTDIYFCLWSFCRIYTWPGSGMITHTQSVHYAYHGRVCVHAPDEVLSTSPCLALSIGGALNQWSGL